MTSERVRLIFLNSEYGGFTVFRPNSFTTAKELEL